MTKVAVIGAGVAGIEVLQNLSQVLTKGDYVDIYESGSIGGSQYSAGTTSLEQQLNQPLESMCFDRYKFADWICDNKELIINYLEQQFSQHHMLESVKNSINELQKTDLNVFMPRIIFGLYVYNTYKNILQDLTNNGVIINEHFKKVDNIDANSKTHDATFMCTGHALSDQQNQDSNRFYPHQNEDIKKYINNLYNNGKKEFNIRIDGTSLSGIDMMFALHSWLINCKDPKVKMNVLLSSRNLVFPKAKSQIIIPESLNATKRAELYNQFIKEYKTFKAEFKKESRDVWSDQKKYEFGEGLEKLYLKYLNKVRAEFDLLPEPETCFKDLKNVSANSKDKLNSYLKDQIDYCNFDEQKKINSTNVILAMSGITPLIIGKAIKYSTSNASDIKRYFLTNTATVPDHILSAFKSALNHKQINLNLKQADKNENKEKYDLVLDASGGTLRSHEEYPVLKNVVADKIIGNQGHRKKTSNIPIYGCSLNKNTGSAFFVTKRETDEEMKKFFKDFNLKPIKNKEASRYFYYPKNQSENIAPVKPKQKRCCIIM